MIGKIGLHNIVQLKNNFIPKGLIPLEKLFDQNDIAQNPYLKQQIDDMEEINLGTNEKPRLVCLLKSLPYEQKKNYITFFKEFTNVFSYNYVGLKTYDTSKIDHWNPLKEGVNPFQQKMRQVNPMLLPMIEKELKKLLNSKIIIPPRYSEWFLI